MTSEITIGQRWTPEAAWKWYKAQPYFVGANFIPSNAINQLEMWQADTFDPKLIDRELGWAAKLGMNAMRVYLHDLLWEQDAAGFKSRLGQYLDIAFKHGIKSLLVIFDDCWNPEFASGLQPKPKLGVHNSGWVQSPGVKVKEAPETWSRLEQYVTGLLAHFRADDRILGWDLYNEPGNDGSGLKDKGEATLRLLNAVFSWARGVTGLTQPLTSGAWCFTEEYKPLNEFTYANSDVITFHDYKPPQDLIERIHELEKLGRPLICTEYMARGAGSSFEYCLPIFKKHNIGAINWGLVSGKTQTIYPWGWNAEKGVPEIWFHDIFNQDGTFIYPNEERAIRQVTGALTR